MTIARIVYSPKGFLVSAALTTLLLLITSGSAFGPMYMMAAIIFLVPFYLQMILRTAGPLPSLMSVLLIGLFLLLRVNPISSFYAVSYLLVPLLVYAYCLQQKLSFENTVLFVILGYSIVVLILYALSFQMLGPDPFLKLSSSLVNGLDKFPDRDSLLSTAYQVGLLALPDRMAEAPLIETSAGNLTLAAEVISEFYKQIAARASLWLRALVPSLISSYTLYLGIGGLFISNYFGRRQTQRRAFKTNKSAELTLPAYPEFSKWYIPKVFVKPLWVMGGISIVSRLVNQDGIMLAGSMLYNIFAAAFSIQGLSYINHIQKVKGTKPPWRALTLVVLLLILPQAALILGMFDQINEFRKNKDPSLQTKFDNRRK